MDYYSILGVNRNATPQEIKKAYKKLAMQHHPDRGGDSQKFQQVTQAYEILSNSDKRNAYDRPTGPDFSFNSRDFQGGNPFSGTPFENIFGQGFQNVKTPRNSDITVKAEITLQDVLKGKDVIIQYQTRTGKLETVTVNIPPGAKHSDTVRYQGLGDDGYKQYPRGDLHVKIKVKKVHNWDRDGDNLITKKVTNVFDLMLGCVIIIQTLDGKQVKLTIPKGTKPGQVFNIPGYGIPNLNTGKRGNLYVELDTSIPDINDEKILQEIENLKKKIYNN